MNSRDFNYWLMGFFELQRPKVLNAEHVELIKKHLDMVFVCEIKILKPTAAYNFCQWLRGCLDLVETKTVNTNQTSIIFKQLSSIFAHEIDNSFGNKKEELQQLHGFRETLPPGMNYDTTKIMC
jgi:hypothetical protein